jgi:hypothetical protein
MTPGTIPSSASFLKQMRQRPNLRRYPLGRPHFRHRWYRRTLNLGFFSCLALIANVAKLRLPFSAQSFRKGMPRNPRRFFASSSLRAVVMMQMFMPRTLSTLW